MFVCHCERSAAICTRPTLRTLSPFVPCGGAATDCCLPDTDSRGMNTDVSRKIYLTPSRSIPPMLIVFGMFVAGTLSVGVHEVIINLTALDVPTRYQASARRGALRYRGEARRRRGQASRRPPVGGPQSARNRHLTPHLPRAILRKSAGFCPLGPRQWRRR